MNVFHTTLRSHLTPKQQAVVLLSGTCKGNDPELPLCPLFHGSLGPYLFSDIDGDEDPHVPAFWIENPDQILLQCFLLNSHCITWSKHVEFPENAALCKNICEKLSETRYSSRSIKSVRLHSATLAISIPFIKSHCHAVEEFGDIVDPRKIKDTDLELLSELPFIKKLQLYGINETSNNGLLHVSKLSSLQRLNVCGCGKITDDGLSHLSNLLSLQHLNLSYCSRIFDDGFVHLSKLSSLQSLYLQGCEQITNGSLVHLSKLSSLELLDVSNCYGITNDGLVHLSKISSLQHVDVGWCKEITNDGLAHLSKLSSLHHLDVRGCNKISDDGLVHLSRLSPLQHLIVSWCNVTKSGVAKLQEKLPHTKIFSNCEE